MPSASEIRYIPDCRVKLDGQRLELGKEAALTRVEVDLNVDLFGQCKLTFHDPHLALINGKSFKAGVRVSVELGFSSKLQPVFDGEVVALEPCFRRDLPPSLEVVCLEGLHRLALSQMTRAFNDVDPKEVTSRIAQEHGLSAEAPAGTKEHMLQSNVTDAVFLRRLAQQRGQHLRIEGKKLVIAPPPKGIDVALAPGDGLRKMKVMISAKAQVQGVSVHGWDPKAKKEIVGKAKGEGEIGEGARKEGKGTLSVAGHEPAPADQATAEAMAKGRMRKLAEGFVVASAQATGDPRLKPGNTVSCSKFGDQINGVYRIEAARHLFSKHGYLVDFRAVRIAKKTAAQHAQERAAHGAATQARAEEAAKTPPRQRKTRDPAAARQAQVLKDAAKDGAPLVEECPSSKGTVAQIA